VVFQNPDHLVLIGQCLTHFLILPLIILHTILFKVIFYSIFHPFCDIGYIRNVFDHYLLSLFDALSFKADFSLVVFEGGVVGGGEGGELG
jgi:hypothetical protein